MQEQHTILSITNVQEYYLFGHYFCTILLKDFKFILKERMIILYHLLLLYFQNSSVTSRL